MVNYKPTYLLHWTIQSYVIPFLKRIKLSKFFCSFKDGFDNAINIASRFLRISVFLEAWHRTFQVKTWLMCLFNCLAGSESLVAWSCSDHLVICFYLFARCNLLHIFNSHNNFCTLGITFYPSNEAELVFSLFPNWLQYQNYFL